MGISDEYAEAMKDEMLQLLGDHAGVELHLDASAALAVIGHLQLALRHPGNTGPSAAVARQVIEQLIDALARGNPRVKELLRRGDDRRFDIERPKPGEQP